MMLLNQKLNGRPVMGVVFAAWNAVMALLGALGLIAGLALAWWFGWPYLISALAGQAIWEAVIAVGRDL